MKALLSMLIPAVLACNACKPKVEMPTPPIAEQSTSTPVSSEPENYVGLTLEQAKKISEAAGTRWRIVEEDGIPKPVTRDYNPTRLNFVMEKGIITKASLG